MDVEDLTVALKSGDTIEDAAHHLCRSGTVDEVRRKAEELGLSYKTVRCDRGNHWVIRRCGFLVRSSSTTLVVARSKAIENLHLRRHLAIFDHCRCYSAERRPKEEIAPLSISSNSFGGAKRMVMEVREELRRRFVSQNQCPVCKGWPAKNGKLVV